MSYPSLLKPFALRPQTFLVVIVTLSLIADDDVEAERAPFLASGGLVEQQCGIIAADATTDAGEWFAFRVVARAATETISSAKVD